MKAVILAGGMGTRISEESMTKPKPMIEIGGRPMLWRSLGRAQQASLAAGIVDPRQLKREARDAQQGEDKPQDRGQRAVARPPGARETRD